MADTKKPEQGQQSTQGQQVQKQQPPPQGQQGQNVPVRQGQQGQQGETTQIARRPRVDQFLRNPFAMMRDFFRDPFGTMMVPMQNDFPAAFEVRETNDSFVFRADVPGVSAEDIDIQLYDHRLSISGSRENEVENTDDRYYTYERSYGSFERVFTLPDTADTEHIRSQLDNGVLTLVVPKKPGTQPRKITVGSKEQAKH